MAERTRQAGIAKALVAKLCVAGFVLLLALQVRNMRDGVHDGPLLAKAKQQSERADQKQPT